MNTDDLERVMFADWDRFDFPRLGLICSGLLVLDVHPVIQLVWAVLALVQLAYYHRHDGA